MSSPKPLVIEPLHQLDPGRAVRHVFVRDMVCLATVGVYDHERTTPQRVRLNLDLSVRDGGAPFEDCLDNVLCYEQIIVKVRALIADGHVNLVETMAERIAAICLQDRRVMSVRVRVEKLDVFKDVDSVGVEIERFSSFS